MELFAFNKVPVKFLVEGNYNVITINNKPYLRIQILKDPYTISWSFVSNDLKYQGKFSSMVEVLCIYMLTDLKNDESFPFAEVLETYARVIEKGVTVDFENFSPYSTFTADDSLFKFSSIKLEMYSHTAISSLPTISIYKDEDGKCKEENKRWSDSFREISIGEVNDTIKLGVDGREVTISRDRHKYARELIDYITPLLGNPDIRV